MAPCGKSTIKERSQLQVKDLKSQDWTSIEMMIKKRIQIQNASCKIVSYWALANKMPTLWTSFPTSTRLLLTSLYFHSQPTYVSLSWFLYFIPLLFSILPPPPFWSSISFPSPHSNILDHYFTHSLPTLAFLRVFLIHYYYLPV